MDNLTENNEKKEIKTRLNEQLYAMFEKIRSHLGLDSQSETIRRIIKKEYDNLKAEGKIKDE